MGEVVGEKSDASLTADARCVSSSSSHQNRPASMERVVDLIREDQLAADVTLSLFSAALCSYRFDSVLNPFPAGFLKDGEKDIEALRDLFEKISAVGTICNKQYNEAGNDRLAAFLEWLLSKQAVSLRSVDCQSTFAEIESRTGSSQYSVPPDYIFKVCRGTAGSTSKFERLRKDYEVLLAYHGSRVENFHSIVHTGLHGHLNKNSLFGYGTYLSTALPVAMGYSPAGSAWCHSRLGPGLSCVAVCEVLDHPGVKRSEEELSTSDASAAVRRKRATADGGLMLGDKIPNKYLVVTNNDLLRVVYLLVYAERKPTPPTNAGQSWVTTSCRQHMFVIVVVLYATVLLFVGLLRSDFYRRLKTKGQEL